MGITKDREFNVKVTPAGSKNIRVHGRRVRSATATEVLKTFSGLDKERVIEDAKAYAKESQAAIDSDPVYRELRSSERPSVEYAQSLTVVMEVEQATQSGLLVDYIEVPQGRQFTGQLGVMYWAVVVRMDWK